MGVLYFDRVIGRYLGLIQFILLFSCDKLTQRPSLIKRDADPLQFQNNCVKSQPSKMFFFFLKHKNVLSYDKVKIAIFKKKKIKSAYINLINMTHWINNCTACSSFENVEDPSYPFTLM